MNKKNQKQKVTPILCDTYIAVIKNSVRSKLFRNFYATINGQKEDITKNGELSCAWFVSAILHLFKLIREPHTTVKGTIKDLERSGWKQIKKPKVRSVLVWEAIDFGGRDIHRHIGFYIGKKKAVSNSYKLGCPVVHHWTFGNVKRKPKRKVEMIFWHKKLEKSR